MTGLSETRGAFLVAATLVTVALATVLFNQPVRFPLDDAYITIANAEQIISGARDSYGQRQPTGATSLVHMLALAGLRLGSGLNMPLAALVLAMVAAAFYVFGLYILLLRVSGQAAVAVLGSIAGLLGLKTWFQLMNGLETGMAMAAVVWTVTLAQDPDDRAKRAWLAGVIGVLPFVRPELAVLSVALGLSACLRLYAHPRLLFRFAAIAACAVAAMAALSWLATGDLVPRTAGAKIAFFADAGLPLFQRLMIALVNMGYFPLGVVLIGLAALPMIRDGWACLAFVAIYLMASAISLPSGLAHNEQRYLYSLVPLALAGWAALSARRELLWGRARLVVSAGAMLMIAGFFVSGWSFYRDSLAMTADQEQLVVWAKANLPRDARILIHDAGYFGWQTDFALVDVVGLKSPQSIPVHRRLTLPSAGRDRGLAVADIARQARVSHAQVEQCF